VLVQKVEGTETGGLLMGIENMKAKYMGSQAHCGV
jgi:hypothetical protein